MSAKLFATIIIAGLPVVAFKGFMVLVLLKVVKDWWGATSAPAINT